MNLKKNSAILAILAILAINLSFGLPRLSKFSAVDERLWTYDRTPQFWNAVKKQKWKSTLINDKPGVTAAIISGIGLLSIDPMKYKSLKQGQEVKSETDIKNIEKINFSFRLPIYLFALLMAPIFFILIKKLFNETVALFSIAMIYLSPIILGISLFVNPDSLLWIFIPLCMISFLLFQKNGQDRYAYLGGFFLGLALLTKYVSAILFIFLPLIIFLDHIFSLNPLGGNNYLKKSLLGYAKMLFASVAIVGIFYPVTWIKPQILFETTFLSFPFKPILPYFLVFLMFLFGDTFFLKNRATLSILNFIAGYKKFILWFVAFIFLAGTAFVFLNAYSGMKILNFESILASAKIKGDGAFVPKIFTGGILTGIYVLIFSVAPIVFLSFICTIAKIFKDGKKYENEYRPVFYFLLFSLIYYCASAANNVEPTVRYQISIYPLIFVIAAIGLYEFIQKKTVKKYISSAIAIIVLTVALSASLFFIEPHYFAYASDLLPKKYVLNLKDMGDGSFEAAQYLNSLPNAQELTIWSDKVAVCEFFVGRCNISLKKKNVEGVRFDYFVVSRGRGPKSASFMESRDISKEKFIDLEKLYLDADFNGHLILIDNRPGNFVKIIKNQTLK